MTYFLSNHWDLSKINIFLKNKHGNYEIIITLHTIPQQSRGNIYDQYFATTTNEITINDDNQELIYTRSV